MLYDHLRREASPGKHSTCPHCDGELIAKCGPIVTWHWAHISSDCDPWNEPESQWHIDWKRWFETHKGARVEVPMGPHRADVVLPNGTIIELQSGYLSAAKIAAREEFYGPQLSWLYRAHWMRRVEVSENGLWWRQGSKAMTTHQRPVWWHTGTELLRVHTNLILHEDDEWGTTTERVVGTIERRQVAPNLHAVAPSPPPPRQLSLLEAI